MSLAEVARRIWHAAFGSGHVGPPPPPGPPEQDPGEYLDLLRRHPGARMTTMRILDERSVEQGVLTRHEHVETEDDEGNLRQIDAYHAGVCSTCGGLLDKEVQPKGICRTCGRVMCSQCHARCCVCGQSCCPQHRSQFEVDGGETKTYCSRHAWLHWWRVWWGIEK